jgi:hypothetical protein
MYPAQAHIGPAFYAAQIFNHTPDNRRVMLGWLMHADYLGMSFSQGMTVPLELSLQATSNEETPFCLRFNPVRELANLSTREFSAEGLNVERANAILSEQGSGELLNVQIELQASHPGSFHVGEYPIHWDPERDEVSFSGVTASLEPGLKKTGIECIGRTIIDRSFRQSWVGGFRGDDPISGRWTPSAT